MTRGEAAEFARRWVDAWNRRDLNAVLSHYVADAKFVSPKAEIFTGNSVVEGKEALSRYWHAASSKIRTLEFKFDRVIWDSATAELAIFYEANLNGSRTRACELMKFDEQGRQLSGEALYGAAV